MPVKAALGHAKAAGEGFNSQRAYALLGDQRERTVLPILGRKADSFILGIVHRRMVAGMRPFAIHPLPYVLRKTLTFRLLRDRTLPY
jgi:hypothetical protein